MAAPGKTTTFLDLSAELRNRIYEYALCREKPILIVLSNVYMPPLLRTCKQIRAEAASIWYLDNEFDFELPGFDPETLIAFTDEARACIGRKPFKFTIFIEGPWREWSELLRWLKSYHDGLVDGIPEIMKEDKRDRSYLFTIAIQAFRMVDLLSGKMSWKEIEEVLAFWHVSTESVMEWGPYEPE